MTLPVVVDVESVVPVVESEVVVRSPATDIAVAETDVNVDVPDTEIEFVEIDVAVVAPDTFKVVPMYTLFAIPTPPLIITLPVVEDVESVVPVVLVDVAVKDPDTEIAVEVSVVNAVAPVTFRLTPM